MITRSEKRQFFFIVIPFSVMIICLIIWFITPILIPRPSPPNEETQPAWSPDGQRLAYVCYLEGATRGDSWLSIMLNPDYAPTSPWSQYTAEAADICIIDINGQN